jgi:hypothetical protein
VPCAKKRRKIRCLHEDEESTVHEEAPVLRRARKCEGVPLLSEITERRQIQSKGVQGNGWRQIREGNREAAASRGRRGGGNFTRAEQGNPSRPTEVGSKIIGLRHGSGRESCHEIVKKSWGRFGPWFP